MRLLLLVRYVAAYSLAVVGAQGRLGRELVQQSLERGWHTVAVVRRPTDPIFRPVRGGGLSTDEPMLEPIAHPLLTVHSVSDPLPPCVILVGCYW